MDTGRVWGMAAVVAAVLGTGGCCKITSCESCQKDDDEARDTSTDTGGTGEDTNTSPLHEPSGWEPSTPVADPEEEIVLVPADGWDDEEHSRLYRTGTDGALAAHATGWPGTSIWEAYTRDRGETWGPGDPPGPIASSGVDWEGSRVTFREPSSGLALMVPDFINYMERPALYLWDDEHGWWDARTLGGCWDGHLGGDAVLDADSAMTYAACLDTLQTQLFKVNDGGLDVDDAAIEAADDVLAAVAPGGRLYVLLLVGAPDNALHIHEYVEEGMGSFNVQEGPLEVVFPLCGEGCRVRSLEQYVVRDGVHHVFVRARLPLVGLWEPPSPTSSPDRDVILHVSGIPGMTFQTRMINVREDGDTWYWLGRLVDIEVHDDEAALYVTLQDDACLRVLQSPMDAPVWEEFGVVPTFHQPRPDGVLIWDDSTMGILDVLPGLRYMSFAVDARSSSCIAPRMVDTQPVDWHTEANLVQVDWSGEQVQVVVDHVGVGGDQNLLCGVYYTSAAQDEGCFTEAQDCRDTEVAPFSQTVSLPSPWSACQPRVIDLVFADVQGMEPSVRLAPPTDAPRVEELLGYAGGTVDAGEPLVIQWEPSGTGTVLAQVFDRADLETPVVSTEVDDVSGTLTMDRDELTGLSYILVRLTRTAQDDFPFPVADGSYIRIHSRTEVDLMLLWP